MEKLVHTYPLDVAETDVKLCSEFLHQVIANSKNEGVLSSAFQLLTSFLQTDAFRKAGIFRSLKLLCCKKSKCFFFNDDNCAKRLKTIVIQFHRIERKKSVSFFKYGKN